MKPKEEIITEITDKARADIMHYTAKMANRYEAHIREAYNAGHREATEDLEAVKEEWFRNGFEDGQKTAPTSETVSLDSSAYDKGYQRGLDDAWEAAKLICCEMPLKELRAVFGTDSVDAIMENYSPEKAITEIKAREDGKKKNVFTNADKFRQVFGDKSEPECVASLAWWDEEYKP